MGADRQRSTARAHTAARWRRREAEITRIAESQHGQIALAQLLATGLSDGAVRHRARSGRLHRVHRGVFALGRPPVTANEHRMAAVLACGPGAALSHAAAAAHLGIRPSGATSIDVTSPRGTGRRQPGLRVHRAALDPTEVVVVERIPTTRWSRTLLDLAETIQSEALAKVVDRAEILRLFDLRELEATVARNPGRHGLASLTALMSSLDPRSERTHSEFERRLLTLLEGAMLPSPEVNATLRLEGRVIHPDFLWRREGLVVEADGWTTHGTRQAFERDRARDALLTRAGYRVTRVTWSQLNEAPALILDTIRAAL